jgi:hypothetical protein
VAEDSAGEAATLGVEATLEAVVVIGAVSVVVEATEVVVIGAVTEAVVGGEDQQTGAGLSRTIARWADPAGLRHQLHPLDSKSAATLRSHNTRPQRAARTRTESSDSGRSESGSSKKRHSSNRVSKGSKGNRVSTRDSSMVLLRLPCLLDHLTLDHPTLKRLQTTAMQRGQRQRMHPRPQ